MNEKRKGRNTYILILKELADEVELDFCSIANRLEAKRSIQAFIPRLLQLCDSLYVEKLVPVLEGVRLLFAHLIIRLGRVKTNTVTNFLTLKDKLPS